MSKRTQHTSTSRRRFLQTTATTGGVLAIGGTYSMRVLAQPPRITLGQIAPMTGSAAEFGPFYRDAAHLGVQHINAAAQEVFGGPLIDRIITEDTNTQPTPAIESARKLVESDGVPAYVGAWSSGVTTATATSVALPNNVLQVSNGSTSPLISVLPEDEGKDLLFRSTSPDTLQGVVVAQLAAGEIFDNHNFKTASTIYVNNPYGQGLSNAFARSFQLRGGTVHAQVPHPEEVQPTYTSQLAAALKDDPDILFCASYPGHTATFLQESRDTFDFTSWLFCDGNKSTRVVEAVGADALAGQYGTAPGQDTDNSAYRDFQSAYNQEFGHDRIPPFTASAYDAAVTIGLALARAVASGAGEFTGPVLRDNLRPVSNPPGDSVMGGSVDGLIEAMRKINEGTDVNYSGPSGAVDYDEAGDVKTPVEIWQFTQGGEIETVQLQGADQIPSE